jgi:hypothetical protein
MSVPQAPCPAKLVVGFFTASKEVDGGLIDGLIEAFGPPDVVSSWFPFDSTTYYEQEMGAPLFRRLLAFERLIEQDRLASIKLITNGLEQASAPRHGRRVNIDPGYLLRERFVLATGKNFTHRVYIGQGIYADLTLIFTRGRFASLPWTYPDYKAANMQTFLMRVRAKYINDIERTHRGGPAAGGNSQGVGR